MASSRNGAAAHLAELDELSNRLDECNNELHILESEVKIALLDVEQRKHLLDKQESWIESFSKSVDAHFLELDDREWRIWEQSDVMEEKRKSVTALKERLAKCEDGVDEWA